MFLRGKFDKSIGQFSVKPMASSSEWFSEGGLPGNIGWNYIVWKYRHPPLNPSSTYHFFKRASSMAIGSFPPLGS